MLLQCPECRKKNVSERAELCPECGYPINVWVKHYYEGIDSKLENYGLNTAVDYVEENNIFDITDIETYVNQYAKNSESQILCSGYYDIRKELENMKLEINNDYNADVFIEYLEDDVAGAIKYLLKTTSCNKAYAIEVVDILENMINTNKADNHELMYDRDKPQCPKCGSTAITAGPLTYRWSSERTINRCSNCGYSWEP